MQRLHEPGVDARGAVVLIAQRLHVVHVLDHHQLRVGEVRCHLLGVLERRDVVEVAVQDQRGHVRIGGAGRDRRIGLRRRLRPVHAGQGALVVEAGPDADRERVERRRRVAGKASTGPSRRGPKRRAGRPRLRVVVADDRQVERLRERGGIGAVVDVEAVLGHQSQQRPVVAGARRGDRGRQVAQDAEVAVDDLDGGRQRALVDDNVLPGAVAVGGVADDRVGAHAIAPAARSCGDRIADRAARPAAAGQPHRLSGSAGRGRRRPGRFRAPDRCCPAPASAAGAGSARRRPGRRRSRRSRRRDRPGPARIARSTLAMSCTDCEVS